MLPGRDTMDWLTTNTPLIIGHRGASAGAPENTLAAFALALEQGADGVELDVQFSADGQIVIIHDATVDRTTNGTGRVADLTLAQLQALDAGAGQTIPTLDELFEAFGPSLLYNIEIKDLGWRDHHLELAVADRIAAYHLERQVLVSSFNPLSVRRARRCLTRATLVGMIRQPRWLRWAYRLAGGEADHPHYAMVDEGYMAWARRHGYRVHVWTVDDPAGAQRLAALGVHGIITNQPGRIRQSLAHT